VTTPTITLVGRPTPAVRLARWREDVTCIWHHYHRLVVTLATNYDPDREVTA